MGPAQSSAGRQKTTAHDQQQKEAAPTDPVVSGMWWRGAVSTVVLWLCAR